MLIVHLFSFSELRNALKKYSYTHGSWAPKNSATGEWLSWYLKSIFKTNIQFFYYCYLTCADLEGVGVGGSDPPPWNLQSLISPVLPEMKKISYFSYLCTSTVIRQTESMDPPLEKFSGSAPVWHMQIKFLNYWLEINIYELEYVAKFNENKFIWC